MEFQLGKVGQSVDEAQGAGALFVIDAVDALKQLGPKGAFHFAKAVVVGLQRLAVQHGQVNVAHGGLPVVGAFIVKAAVPVVAQGGHKGRQLGVAHIEHAALAKGGEVFVRMERKNGHVAKGASLFAVNHRADSLSRVFNEDQAALFAQGGNGGHVGHIAIQMYHHHGLGAGGNGLFDGFGSDNPCQQVYVSPSHCGALFDIGVGRSRKRVRGHDHFVTGLEAAQLGRKFQRRNAVHGHKAAALGNTLIGGKFAFKIAHVHALGKGVGTAHGLHNHRNFFFCIADGTATEIYFNVHADSLWQMRRRKNPAAHNIRLSLQTRALLAQQPVTCAGSAR